MWLNKPNKSQAYHLKPLSQFSFILKYMIPQRLELRTYPYQEYALPIKLRNLIKTIHNVDTPFYSEFFVLKKGTQKNKSLYTIL